MVYSPSSSLEPKNLVPVLLNLTFQRSFSSIDHLEVDGAFLQKGDFMISFFITLLLELFAAKADNFK